MNLDICNKEFERLKDLIKSNGDLLDIAFIDSSHYINEYLRDNIRLNQCEFMAKADNYFIENGLSYKAIYKNDCVNIVEMENEQC